MGLQNINLGTTPGDKTGDPAHIGGQKINANFQYLENKIDSVNVLVSSAGFTLAGQNLTMTTGWQWIINNIDYTNPADVVFNIPFAATGKQRIDLIVMNTSNTFQSIPGTESTGTPVQPLLPANMLQATIVVVGDGVVNPPSDPIMGASYKEKAEDSPFAIYGSGLFQSVPIIGKSSVLSLKDSITQLEGMQINNNWRSGQSFYLKNDQTVAVVLPHNVGTLTSTEMAWFFYNGANLTVQPNQVIQFCMDMTNKKMQYVGIVSDVTKSYVDTGLALKLDSSAYNDRFKGKYTSLSVLNTAHPTSNDGDYAIVDAGSGSNAQEYIWDAQDGWVLGTNMGAATTDALAEGSTNLYFKTARVLATVLSGLSTTVGGSIVSTDTVLQAFGKLQNQITDLTTTVSGKVDKTTTVNGKVLSSNITINASDVGAPSGSGTSSGTNTGDETATTIKSKLSITTLSGSNTGDETATSIATIHHSVTAKTTLVDADEVTGQDSANGFSLIRTTWLNVWAYIKSKADAVYLDLSSPQNVSGVKTFLDGKFGLRNAANTFTLTFTNAITAARNVTWPDKSGTIALTSDLSSAVLAAQGVTYAEQRVCYTGQSASENFIGISWVGTATTKTIVNAIGLKYQTSTGIQTVGIRNWLSNGGLCVTQNNSLFFRFSIGNTANISFLNAGYGNAGSGAFSSGFRTPLMTFGFETGDTNFQIAYNNGTGAGSGIVKIDTGIPISTNVMQVKIVREGTLMRYYVYDETLAAAFSGSVTVTGATVVYGASTLETICASNGSSGQVIDLNVYHVINRQFYNF